jgi:hypothetical protein
LNRREFSKALKVAIRKRATRDGVRYCEQMGCGAQAMRGEVHHIRQDAMEVDKTRKLTAADGLYLCLPCHRIESDRQAGELSKALAREAAHHGEKKARRPIPSRPKEKAPERAKTEGMSEIWRRFQRPATEA